MMKSAVQFDIEKPATGWAPIINFSLIVFILTCLALMIVIIA